MEQRFSAALELCFSDGFSRRGQMHNGFGSNKVRPETVPQRLKPISCQPAYAALKRGSTQNQSKKSPALSFLSRTLAGALALSLLIISAHAAAKPHVVSFGKWQNVKLFADDEEQSEDVRVRPLYVDTKLKEFTTGPAHEVTDRIFVARRAYRVNDALPSEDGKASRWRWQLGGWLQVDRVSGRVAAIALSEFDPYESQATWYRDYVAYCGISDDGKKLFAVVAQLGRRKPVLKKSLGDIKDADDTLCAAPVWHRQPALVTFQPKGADKLTYSVRGRSADLVTEEEVEQ